MTSFNFSPLAVFVLIVLSISACSSNAPKQVANTSVQVAKSTEAMGVISKVEIGTIVQLKTIVQTNDTSLADSGSIGVSVGSGGHSGIYGSINAANILRALRKPPKLLELIVKKSDGSFVSVTQSLGGNFNVGDKVKILLRNGRALVQH